MSIELIKKAEQAFYASERKNIESLWDELAEFIMPNMDSNFNGASAKGERKTRRLYDSIGIQANHDLASAMHSTLTNPQTKWAALRFRDESLNNNEEAVAWLDDSVNRIHSALAESNFDTEIGKAYLSLPCLGTMCLLQEEKKGVGNNFRGFRFQAIHMSELAFEEDCEGRPDIVYRKFMMNPRQIVQRWGGNAGRVIRDLSMSDSGSDRDITVYHCVMRRKDKEISYDAGGLAPPNKRPYKSIYIADVGNHILEETGYYENPYHIARWSTTPGEVYGRSPGHIALPDVRTVNAVKKLTLEGVEKAIHPPTFADQMTLLSDLDLRPRKINVVANVNGIKEFVTNARFEVSQFTVQQLHEQIKSIFFIDKLLLPPRTETGEMTAYEVSQRLQQMQKVLGPVLSRLNNELLSPIVLRSFNMLLRGGEFMEPPSIVVSGGEAAVDIIFLNSLSRAQRFEEISNIQQWAQHVAQMAQINPEAVDYIDVDGITKHLAKTLSIPEIAVRNDKEVAQLRQQRQQMQAAQMALQAGEQAANIESKLGGK